ncbi:MAG: hypothetical protein IJQ12_00505 [Lachnospiraceae bacterium]|nr:hypothetical protein [Lachnospiraceae bacterium]
MRNEEKKSPVKICKILILLLSASLMVAGLVPGVRHMSAQAQTITVAVAATSTTTVTAGSETAAQEEAQEEAQGRTSFSLSSSEAAMS